MARSEFHADFLALAYERPRHHTHVSHLKFGYLALVASVRSQLRLPVAQQVIFAL